MTDESLGGYQRVHERAPAFGGPDGRSYSVATFVDDAPDVEGRYGAALLFLRWSDTGDHPVGHLETDYLAFGRTAAEALEPVLRLTLHEVKAHLDGCINTAGQAAKGGGAV